jgi:hypothetical protein
VRLLYLECRAGISGDMAAGALLDLLGEEAWPRLERALGRLDLRGASVSVRRIRKQGFAAVDFETAPETGAVHRNLDDIEALLESGGLPPRVLDGALGTFRALARAEAEVHGVEPSRIHFHEVGAADSVLDIVTALWALEELHVERVACSPLPLGEGAVRCAHGELPLPAPATVALVRGVPVYGGDFGGETVTPTGAALAVTLADEFGPLPPGRIVSTGVGAGKAERRHLNVLRAHLLDAAPGARGEAALVVEIQADIDDMSPEAYRPLLERLFAAGALDAHLAPVQMKKDRPGVLLTVISPPGQADDLARTVLTHSTTFGVRFSDKRRLCLERETGEVETPYGRVRIKRGMLDGAIVKSVPEYEDCRARAAEADVPFLDVYEAALAAARR